MFSHSYAAWYHAGAPAPVPRHAISKTAMDHGYTMGEVGMPLGEKGENFTAVFLVQPVIHLPGDTNYKHL